MKPSSVACGEGKFQLRFECLFDAELFCAFPCDAAGQVDIDALDERARNMYFYARTAVGREFSPPSVRPVPRPGAQTTGTLAHNYSFG